MVSFYLPSLPDEPDVRVVVRWRDGHASHAEIAALRQLLPELRDRPAADVFREARASTEWALATCHPAHVPALRKQAERVGLIVIVEPVTPPALRTVPDGEVVAELVACGLAVADCFLMDGLVCSIDTHGELMGLSIDDEALAVATKAYLRRAGVREYGSYPEFVAAHQAPEAT